MILRIFEYDTQVALKTSAIVSDNTLEITMPNTGILYLRSNSSTPDKMTIKIITPSSDFVTYDVPIMKLRDYDSQAILRKELYFLLPFYLFNFEEDFDKIEAGDMAVTESFRKQFPEPYDRLKDLLEHKQIDVMTHHSIIMLTKKVIAALTGKMAVVKEEADKIMGGQVLDYETKVIFREGFDEGIDQGIYAMVNVLRSMSVDDDTIVKKIMSEFHVSEEKAREYL